MTKLNLRDALRAETTKNIVGTGSFTKSYLSTDKVTLYKTKKDKQLIDTIPFVIKTDNFPRKKKGDIVYVMAVTEHKDVGIDNTIEMCLKGTFGRACPICEEREKLKDSGASKDELIAAFPMSWRAFYNVLDWGEENIGIQVWDVAFNWVEKKLRQKAERLAQDAGPNENGDLSYIIFADLEDGRHIEYTGVPDTYNKNEYIKPEGITFVVRGEPIAESWMEKAISLETLLIIPTYEELKCRYFAIDKKVEEMEKDKTVDKMEESPIKKTNPIPITGGREERIQRLLEKQKRKAEEEAKKVKVKNQCPYDYIFGSDCDEYPECEGGDGDGCEKWNECSDAFHAQIKAEVKVKAQ